MKLFTILTAAAMIATVHGAENLIQNGDFSQSGTAWKSPQYTGGKKFHTFDGDKLYVSGNVNARYNSFASLIQELPLLDPAKEYLLKADVTVNVPDTAKKFFRISIRQASGAGKSLRYTDLNVDMKKSGTQTYAIKFRPLAAAEKFYVYVLSGSFDDNDSVTVDNISLAEIATDQNAAANLVQNGDFENKSLAPWKSFCGKAKNRPFAIVTDNSTANSYLTVNGDPQNKYANFLTLIQPLPQLMAGKKYQLKVKIKAGLADTAKKEVWIAVRESDMDNVTIVYDGIRADLANNLWKTYILNIIPRVEADKFELYVRSTRLADGDTVCVDDISITPVK